jgi:hypothetical protein
MAYSPLDKKKVGLKRKEETSEMLHVKRSFICCVDLDTSESRSEIPGKFWDVMKEKDEENWLDRSREKWRNITYNRNIIHTCTILRRKANWIVHCTLHRNCLLKHFLEENVGVRIEVTGWRRIGRKQLLDDRKETLWCCKMKEETLYGTVWRTRFGRTCNKIDYRM